MRIFAGILLCALAVGSAWCDPARVPDQTIWRFVQPDAKALLWIEWRKVLESEIGELIARQIQESGLPDSGLEFLSDIESILISSTGIVDEKTQRPELLVVVKGHLQPEKLREMALAEGAVIEKHKNVELLMAPKAYKHDLGVSFLGNDTVLLGDRNSVIRAIDRAEAEAANTNTPLFSRAAELAATHEIWAVVAAPVTNLAGSHLPASKLAADIEGLEAGISLSKSVAVHLNVQTKSEEAASNLSSTIQTMISFIALQQKDQPQITEILKQLNIGTEGAAVKIGFSIDPDKLPMNFQQLRAALEMPRNLGALELKPAMRAEPKPMRAEPKPPATRMIKIYGLESGPVQIPYPQ